LAVFFEYVELQNKLNPSYLLAEERILQERILQGHAQRLLDKVELDSNTSRRLFTLVCVLHIKG